MCNPLTANVSVEKWQIIYFTMWGISNRWLLTAHLPSLFWHSRLGHKIQGVLCDGDSNEVVASTVVNCLKIDEGEHKRSHIKFKFGCFMKHHLTYLTLSAGTITIVREGCVPAVKVFQIFERIKSTMLWLLRFFSLREHMLEWLPSGSAALSVILSLSFQYSQCSYSSFFYCNCGCMGICYNKNSICTIY